MKLAIEEAESAFSEGEVPVGAVLAGSDGRILARAHNRPIALKDPTAHAEILALRHGGAVVGNYRLNGCILAVTVEPCFMCMGAIIHARIARLVFGAFDPKAGAAGSLYDLSRDARLNHKLEVVSGITGEPCQELMRRFFQARRGI
ncbi:MAG: tRNA adenosine(34) deaminase TadA [Deltaproteobacteria bacterium]|nr:tRNA adenosine(34) deaminase TadA [Deltaproteobacteria bacterium]